jgi:hypothetical protein
MSEVRSATFVSGPDMEFLVPEVRIELTTYPLPRGCATTTLLRQTAKPALKSRDEATAAAPIAEGVTEEKSGQHPPNCTTRKAGGSAEAEPQAPQDRVGFREPGVH